MQQLASNVSSEKSAQRGESLERQEELNEDQRQLERNQQEEVSTKKAKKLEVASTERVSLKTQRIQNSVWKIRIELEVNLE